MSTFVMNLNYFPKQLHNVIAPTDTRRRPDQRALELGDFKIASKEKERLEKKQRETRKKKEEKGEDHVPAYFI